MPSAMAALAWEFWAANRRGWLLVVSAIPLCAVVYRLLPQPIEQSEMIEFLVFLPFVASVILAAGFCNFTDPIGKSYVAGFPRHLFARPLSTSVLVTSVMAFSVVSVVGVYVAWVKLVLTPLGVHVLVMWPATVIAGGVVTYQAIVWGLSGLRITRIVVLSVALTCLVGIAIVHYAPETVGGSLSDGWIEALTIAMLAGVVVLGYAAALVSVGLQRRGADVSLTNVWKTLESILDAVPRRIPDLQSADAALAWLEWRRAGLLLPAIVAAAAILILGPALAFTGRGPHATLRAVEFLAMLPLILAYPIGKGFAKPDLWSLDMSLSPFLAARPVTSAQFVSAKLKAAVWSSVAAWVTLLVIAVPWLYATCNLRELAEMARIFTTIYSPISLWSIAILGLLAAAVVTSSILLSNIWLGYSGRPVVYYTAAGVTLAIYAGLLIGGLIVLNDQKVVAERIVTYFLPSLPWLLAAAVTVKFWVTVAAVARGCQKRIVSRRMVDRYAFLWLAVTAMLVVLAVLISPRIIWLRDVLILTALLAVPLARIALAPLVVSWNRHQ